MVQRTWSLLAALMACFLISGCKKYRPSPLVPMDVFRSVSAQRKSPDRDPSAPAGATSELVAEPLTLRHAADWLRRYGPEVQETLAEYRTALAMARVKTPLPNPGLEIGPQFGFGPDIGRNNRVSPFGSIGFAIPLGKRLRRQNELNRALAEVARVHALARFRELYLELRSTYSNLAIAKQRLEARKEISEAARKSLKAGKKLVEAGQATALDVALFGLEEQRSLVEVLEAERMAAREEAAMSRLLGVHYLRTRELPPQALPKLPAKLPDFDVLQAQMIANQTDLARLRAEYEASERALRLEISKQFPDFQFGPSFDSEVGEKKTVIGLTLGIEIPLFDRNQQGIADATKRREGSRVKYEAEVRRTLAELERAYRAVELARKNTMLLREKILPQAESNVSLARRTVEAGAADALRMLDAERSVRSVRIEALEAQLAERDSWFDLEKAVGLPLIDFPDEALDVRPPNELEASGAKQIKKPMVRRPEAGRTDE